MLTLCQSLKKDRSIDRLKWFKVVLFVKQHNYRDITTSFIARSKQETSTSRKVNARHPSNTTNSKTRHPLLASIISLIGCPYGMIRGLNIKKKKKEGETRMATAFGAL